MLSKHMRLRLTCVQLPLYSPLFSCSPLLDTQGRRRIIKALMRPQFGEGEERKKQRKSEKTRSKGSHSAEVLIDEEIDPPTFSTLRSSATAMEVLMRRINDRARPGPLSGVSTGWF